MRITAEAKRETRERILEAAERLFRDQGFEAVTTRSLARASGIAAGTLFNYFPTKEDVALELIQEALERAAAAHEKRSREHQGIEEGLFSLIAAGLRELRPMRAMLPSIIESCLGPARLAARDETAESLRASHLETAARLASKYGYEDVFTAVAQQLYWTLLIGVLAFWSRDGSHKQEDTLALLDASLKMFTDWLSREAPAAILTETE